MGLLGLEGAVCGQNEGCRGDSVCRKQGSSRALAEGWDFLCLRQDGAREPEGAEPRGWTQGCLARARFGLVRRDHNHRVGGETAAGRHLARPPSSLSLWGSHSPLCLDLSPRPAITQQPLPGQPTLPRCFLLKESFTRAYSVYVCACVYMYV